MRTLGLILVTLTFVGCGGSGSSSSDSGVSNDMSVSNDLSSGQDLARAPDGGQADDGGVACNLAPVTITHDSSTASTPYIHVLDTTKYKNAVCNDGTPATYIFRPGVGKATKRWLIYLEGGGSCATDADCYARYTSTPGYMTTSGSDGQVYSVALEGIKSPDPSVNPDFYDANYVQIPYCSSDAWTGDVAGDSTQPTTSAKHWSFRGRQIAQSVFKELMANGLAGAEEVMLLGSSAGGVGTIAHADELGGVLSPTTRYVSLIDAGFFIDYPSYDPTTKTESTAMPTQRELDLQAGIATWASHGDASCEAAATTQAQLALCQAPAQVIIDGFITTPMFIRESEYDGVQLKQFIDTSENDAAANAYRQRWSAEMMKQLGEVSAATAIFSRDDTQHGVINDDAQWSKQVVNGTTLVSDISSWYSDPCHNATHIIQSQ